MYDFFDFDYNNAVFEWDDNKADINFKKHGIRFETAVKIFTDNNKLIWYDEDCPKMTEKMLQQFHRMNSVIVKISLENIEKVKSLKPDYPSILSHLLNLALNDSDLLKKCI